jgi:hypothetical protein
VPSAYDGGTQRLAGAIDVDLALDIARNSRHYRDFAGTDVEQLTDDNLDTLRPSLSHRVVA